jgi:hypothetical protein
MISVVADRTGLRCDIGRVSQCYATDNHGKEMPIHRRRQREKASVVRTYSLSY